MMKTLFWLVAFLVSGLKERRELALFRVLFVLVIMAHNRKRVLHFNVTEHPTAFWTAQQMIPAFPRIPHRAI